MPSRNESMRFVPDLGFASQRVRVLYGSIDVVLINLVTAPVAAALMWPVYPVGIQLGWISVVFVVVAARVLLWRRYWHYGQGGQGATNWGRSFALGATVNGCLWGLLASVVFMTENPYYYVLAGFVVGGMTAGAAMRDSAYLPAFYGFAVPAISPLVVALLVKGGLNFGEMGLLLTLFAVVLLLSGRDNNRQITDNINLTIEQVRLHSDLLAATAASQEEAANRKKFLASLEFANTLLTTTMETSPDAILAVDEHARIISSNQRFAEMWKIPQELMNSAIDGPILEAVVRSMKDPVGFAARVEDLYAHPEKDGRDQLETNDGRFVDRYTAGLRTATGDYLGRVWFFRDITERVRAEADVRHLARHDVLTGIANRLVFMEAVEQAIARADRGGNPFAVLYLDLDHFKDVNDTLGHPVGDRLLCAVAERLKQTARKTDVVARFGGDEFAIIAADIDEPTAAANLADKLVTALGKPFLIDGNEIRSGASVGIAVHEPAGANGPEILLSHADVALYRAKSDGRGGYRFFTDAMDVEVRTRVTLSAELQEALASGQLFLQYQPQIEFKTERIIGVEALVRWRHPRLGVLSPGEFIPVAEKTGLIIALDRWVKREACRQAKAWLDAGATPLVISVNVSGAQFKRALEFEKDVAVALKDSGLPRHLLELELTETVLMEASLTQNDVLGRLRGSGIKLAIDDFGTGYSSLDYLRQFPVHRVKIAQVFVGQIVSDPGSAAIVRATIALTRELGIVAIAEGVETIDQFELLKAWGCPQMQGYYFAKPLEPDDFLALLRRSKISESLALMGKTAA